MLDRRRRCAQTAQSGGSRTSMPESPGGAMDDSLKGERYAALGGGVLFIVLVIASIVIPGSTPMSSDSPTKILNYFRDHKHEIEVAAFIGGLAAVPILWWAGSLWARLRRAEGGQPRLALVAVLGLLVGGAGQLVSSSVLSTVALRLDSVGQKE